MYLEDLESNKNSFAFDIWTIKIQAKLFIDESTLDKSQKTA